MNFSDIAPPQIFLLRRPPSDLDSACVTMMQCPGTWVTQDQDYAPPDDLLAGTETSDDASQVIVRLAPYDRVEDARHALDDAAAAGRDVADFAPPGPAHFAAAGLNPTCDVVLLGTAHVSHESCAQVRAAVAAFRPDIVVVELCEQRRILLAPPPEGGRAPPKLDEMLRQYQSGKANPLHLVLAWFSAAAAAEFGTEVGAEFRAAADAARGIGAKLVLGDRALAATVARVWAAVSTWHRLCLVPAVVGGVVQLGISGEDMELEMENLKAKAAQEDHVARRDSLPRTFSD